MSDSLRPHGRQCTRLLCPSLSPGVRANACQLSRWCHPTISFSVVLFSCCPQSFPASASFPVSWKYWGFSFSINPSSEYSGLISFRIDWFDLLAVQGTLKSLLQHHSSKVSILQHSALFMVHLSNLYITTRETIVLTVWTSVSKVMALLFSRLFRFIIAFLPRSKYLLISWLQSPSSVILEPKKLKSVTISIYSPSLCHEVMKPDTMILVFECWVLSQLFFLSSLPLSRGFLVPLHFLPLEWCYLYIWVSCYFSWKSWFQLVSHSAWHFARCTLLRS